MNISDRFMPREHAAYRLAEKIRDLRISQNLTQKQVANIAGLNESTIRNYELARRTPSQAHISGIARALHVAPESLIEFDDHISNNELLHILTDIVQYYGLSIDSTDEYVFLMPSNRFFMEAFKAWASAYAALCKNEQLYRGEYESWKNCFQMRFNKQDFSRIYPQYDPKLNDSSQRWIQKETSTTLKAIRFEQDLNQVEVADEAQISLSALRSYEQGKRIPKPAQKQALCAALDINESGLNFTYLGSPNQALHYLFEIASIVSLTPEISGSGMPLLKTNGTWIEWSLLRYAQEADTCSDSPNYDEHMRYWISSFDPDDQGELQQARKEKRLRNGVLTQLPPRA